MPTQIASVSEARRATASGKRFPKRDYILLPLLSVLTLLLLFGLAEIGTRLYWPAREDTSCDVFDRYGNLSAKPNCTIRTKIAEGPWVSYRFNECGYRTDASCTSKPAGTFRVVLLGSSISEGLEVPYEETFGQRTAHALTRATGRPVEFESLGFENLSPLACYRRINAALELRPDLVVYAVTPFDLDQRIDPVQLAHRNDPLPTAMPPPTHFKLSPIKRLQREVNDSRALLVAQHLLFSNTETYLRLYLAYGDRADYLRTPLTPKWQAKFSDFDLVLSDMAARLHNAGIPLVVMAVPSRPQAALLSVAARPPHTDPFAFGLAIGDMAP